MKRRNFLSSLVALACAPVAKWLPGKEPTVAMSSDEIIARLMEYRDGILQDVFDCYEADLDRQMLYGNGKRDA